MVNIKGAGAGADAAPQHSRITLQSSLTFQIAAIRFVAPRPMIPDSTLQFRPLTVTALHAMHVLFIAWPTMTIHLSSTVDWTEVPTSLCTLQSIHKQTHRIAHSIIMYSVCTAHCTHTTPTHLCGAGYIHEPPPLPDAMLQHHRRQMSGDSPLPP